MAQENVEIVRRFYAIGDRPIAELTDDFLRELVDPGVEYDTIPHGMLGRVRSAMGRGGYKRGPYTYVTDARDENPDYTPTRHRRGSGGDDDIPGAGGLAGW